MVPAVGEGSPARQFPRVRTIQPMGLARELERRLERLVDGVSGAIFRGRVHPVDLGTRLVREADLKIVNGPAGPSIPNVYKLALNRDDLEAAGPLSRLIAELINTLESTAADRGWRLEGPAEVQLFADDSIKSSHLKIVSSVKSGHTDPWGQLIGSGRHAQLGPNRVLIGRSEDCDVTVPDPEMSRHHAIIHRQEGRTWITDLGSANGTSVDGTTVTGTSALRPGAQLTLGPVTFMFRLVEA